MINKENHVEVSEGGTELIANKNCPLHAPLSKDQVFHDTICCVVAGQPPARNYRCPYYFKVTCTDDGFYFDCEKE